MKKLSDWNSEAEYFISNVIVVDPSRDRKFPGYIGVKDGSLMCVEEGDAPGGDKPVFDGEGLHISPGFIDMHCHLREPGFEYKEDIKSGTTAAVAGGFVSVACMPNTSPPIDDKSVVDYILRKARIADMAKVYPVAAATVARRGEKLCEYGRLVEAGVVAVSDDGAPIASTRMVRRVFEYAAHFNIPVIEHCEDVSVSAGGVMNESFYSTKLGLTGIPAFGEEICLARDLIILKYVRSRLHVAHVSTRGTVDLIRKAKEKGLAVTAETAPHYFSLEDGELESYDTNFKVNPPLRSSDDVKAVIEALVDGTIDCIATDHAPHAVQEKEVEFDNAPFGAIGLETALSVIISELVKPGHVSLAKAVSFLTVNPAKILGIPGGTLTNNAPADLTLFDPGEEWTVDEKDFLSKSRNSPYIGRTLYGKVKYTVIDGRVIPVDTLKAAAV